MKNDEKPKKSIYDKVGDVSIYGMLVIFLIFAFQYGKLINSGVVAPTDFNWVLTNSLAGFMFLGAGNLCLEWINNLKSKTGV